MSTAAFICRCIKFCLLEPPSDALVPIRQGAFWRWFRLNRSRCVPSMPADGLAFRSVGRIDLTETGHPGSFPVSRGWCQRRSGHWPSGLYSSQPLQTPDSVIRAAICFAGSMVYPLLIKTEISNLATCLSFCLSPCNSRLRPMMWERRYLLRLSTSLLPRWLKRC